MRNSCWSERVVVLTLGPVEEPLEVVVAEELEDLSLLTEDD